MTLSEPDTRPKPSRPRRFGLYAPLVVLLVAACAWSLGWFWLRGEVYRQMDGAARSWEEAGYRVDWASRTVSGFPFRLNVDAAGARLSDLSGWGLAAPRLKAEAFVFAPDHWVLVAPAGVVLQRPAGGPVVVGARILRASVSEAGGHPPRVSVEGFGLTFTPAPGGAPFGLASAGALHLHTRAGPADQGAFYAEIDGARVRGPGLLNDVAAGAPLTLIADAIYSHAGALRGQGLARALRDWGDSGGTMAVRRLSLQTGPMTAEATSGTLDVGRDGRLRGALIVKVKPAAGLMAALVAPSRLTPETSKAAQAVLASHSQGDVAVVTVDFQAGQTTLGPVAIGASPRIY